MKFVLLILTLFIFGCSLEKRLHRPGFHFKKASTFQTSKKEKNTVAPDFKSISSIDSNSTSLLSQIENTTKDQSKIKVICKKRTLKKAKNDTTSVHTREKITDTNQQKIGDIITPIKKNRAPNSKEKQPDKETSTLVTIANVLAIMCFVFAILTLVSIAMAFIMSLTLILPLLPALGAFFSGGLSLILGLPTKQEKYKSGLAVIGLITSLLFFGFFIAVLNGAILI